ncbi:MAG: hypothetical protein WDZ41_03925 [Candidatus Babeliales bacterium]
MHKFFMLLILFNWSISLSGISDHAIERIIEDVVKKNSEEIIRRISPSRLNQLISVFSSTRNLILLIGTSSTFIGTIWIWHKYGITMHDLQCIKDKFLQKLNLFTEGIKKEFQQNANQLEGKIQNQEIGLQELLKAIENQEKEFKKISDGLVILQDNIFYLQTRDAELNKEISSMQSGVKDCIVLVNKLDGIKNQLTTFASGSKQDIQLCTEALKRKDSNTISSESKPEKHTLIYRFNALDSGISFQTNSYFLALDQRKL